MRSTSTAVCSGALDDLPIRYPADPSPGVELRILKRLFTPEEAEVALALSALPEPVEAIAGAPASGPHARRSSSASSTAWSRRARSSAERLLARDGRKRYSRAPLVIGMYEAQVDRLTKELQQDFEQYSREGFATALLDGRRRSRCARCR